MRKIQAFPVHAIPNAKRMGSKVNENGWIAMQIRSESHIFAKEKESSTMQVSDNLLEGAQREMKMHNKVKAQEGLLQKG